MITEPRILDDKRNQGYKMINQGYNMINETKDIR